MPTIEQVIEELRNIPHALWWGDGDPKRPPRRRTAGAGEANQVEGDPVLDDSGWDVLNRDRLTEYLHGARARIEDNQPSGQSTDAGTDALAWYVSFHCNQHAWGIYIPLSSLVIMDELYLKEIKLDRLKRMTLAWRVLVDHERMHFAVDYGCAWLELMLAVPIRHEFHNRMTAPPGLLPVAQTYLEIEETAANALMLRQVAAREQKSTVKALEDFVRCQPRGYREALDAVGEPEFDAAVRESLRSYAAVWAAEYDLHLGSTALDLQRILPLWRPEALATCPVYVLNDLEQIGLAPDALRLVTAIAEIREPLAFLKALEKQPPDIQKAWDRRKRQLQIAITVGSGLELMKGRKPPLWSLRLNKGYRVHLQAPSTALEVWTAVQIGNHKEMGHG